MSAAEEAWGQTITRPYKMTLETDDQGHCANSPSFFTISHPNEGEDVRGWGGERAGWTSSFYWDGVISVGTVPADCCFGLLPYVTPPLSVTVCVLMCVSKQRADAKISLRLTGWMTKREERDFCMNYCCSHIIIQRPSPRLCLSFISFALRLFCFIFN